MTKTCVITATSGRPTAFALLVRWMDNQTFSDFDWHICCDDWEGYKVPKRKNIKFHKRTHDDNGTYNSMQANYLHLLDVTKDYDRTSIVEDDDYYAPAALHELNKCFDRGDLVGFASDAYYYVLSRKARRMHNQTWSSLACTGITRSVVPVLREVIETNDTYFDTPLWTRFTGKKYLKHNFWHIGMHEEPRMKNGIVVDEKPLHVGIKQNWHGGKDGATAQLDGGGLDWYGETLKRWIGDEDAEVYLKMTKPPALGTAGILTPYPTCDLG